MGALLCICRVADKVTFPPPWAPSRSNVSHPPLPPAWPTPRCFQVSTGKTQRTSCKESALATPTTVPPSPHPQHQGPMCGRRWTATVTRSCRSSGRYEGWVCRCYSFLFITLFCARGLNRLLQPFVPFSTPHSNHLFLN